MEKEMQSKVGGLGNPGAGILKSRREDLLTSQEL